MQEQIRRTVVELRETPVAPRPPVSPLRKGLRALVMLILAAAVVAAGLLGNRWLVSTKAPVPRQAVVERPKSVDVVVARVGTVRPEITAFGQVSAGRRVDLRMQVAGEVLSVDPAFAEGGIVRAGQALVTLDPFDHEGTLVRARAELAEGEARVAETQARIRAERDAAARAEEQRAIAARELERVTDLSRRGTASAAELDASQLRLVTAAAAGEARTNQIRVLESQLAREAASLGRLRWNVTSAERDVEQTRLLAPFSGVLSNVEAEQGRMLNVSDRVATLVDLDRLEVRFSLSDGQFGRFVAAGERLEGRPVTLRWRGGGAVIEREARVERIAPTVAANAGGVDVFARLAPADGRQDLRPGAFVEVSIEDVAVPGVAAVPQSAIHPGQVIYRIREDDRLVPIPVEIAGYDGDAALVRGEIPEGSRIVATRLAEAGPGVLVRPGERP